MEIYKIIIATIIIAVICVYLKNINSEYYLLTLLCGGVILLFLSLKYLQNTFYVFHNLFKNTGINQEFFTLIIKITLIAYVIEFASGLIEDFGLKGLADKLTFVGKIVLLSLSLPILTSVLQLISSLFD